MKIHSKVVSGTILRSVLPVAVMIVLMVLPSLVFGQNPGDNPDAEPQAVPLDPRLTVLLMAAGAFLAMKVMKKMHIMQSLQKQL